MDPVAEHLQKLEKKIRQLVEEHQKCKTERDLMVKESLISKRTIEKQNIEIENLNKQVQAMQIAKSVETGVDTGKANDKIQDRVREIDRCIELLNK